ncbi:MAG: DUF1643 domain-containing protein, partial [Alloalcanivorax venustensis]
RTRRGCGVLFDTEPIRSAVFSECRTWRYIWQRQTKVQNERVCNFLMLNPSTADEKQDDPTTQRCVSFAEAAGCGWLHVTNLFAFRATEPADMKAAADPVGPENDERIREVAYAADVVVAAWGADGAHLGRADHVLTSVLAEPAKLILALRLTNGGQPWHPLYLPGDLMPSPFYMGGRKVWLADEPPAA